MKIIHLTPTYIPAYRHGGPVLSVHYLNKWLVKKGIDVSVYTTNINGRKTIDIQNNNSVEIDGVKIKYFRYSWPRSWEYSRELYKALKNNLPKADLLHITSVFLSASTIGARYAKMFNKPFIISPRGSLMNEPLSRKSVNKKKIYLSLVERANLASANAIHFTVKKEKEEYIKANLPFKKSIIIPNGLDEEDLNKDVPIGYFRKKHNIDKDKKIILFLSRISWKKGLDTLIPSFASISKSYPNTILLIAGGDEEGYKVKVEKMIEEYGLRDKVRFTGMILSEEKIGALQDSDIFVLPSYSENFGMAVAEAMYFSLPVIITDGVGISSDIKNSNSGIVVRKDVDELTRAIDTYLSNDERARKDGERGAEFVREKYSMDKIADEFIESYQEVIENNK